MHEPITGASATSSHSIGAVKMAEQGGIAGQTERQQELAGRLADAVATITDRLHMLTRPVDAPDGILGFPEPEGLSIHARAMFEANNGIEQSISALQELAARIDH